MFPSIHRSVSDIRNTFESKFPSSSSSSGAGQQAQSRSTRKGSGLLANMAPSKRAGQALTPLQPSIDAVQGDVAAHPSSAGIHLTRKPSWIGPLPPPRVPSPDPSIMQQQYPVTIEYTSPGLQPPVYICTSLSDPPWEPIEMDSTQSASGEHSFSIDFLAEEGEYQYKLRLGPGDWWVCDESKPKVDDGAGNENNLVVVQARDTDPSAVDDAEEPTLHKVDSHTGPLMPHEMNIHPDIKAPVELTAQASESVLRPQQHDSPLFGHESLGAPEKIDCGQDDYDIESSPLLRHETVSLTSHEQEHSPLFRHESIAIDHKPSSFKLPGLGVRKLSDSSIPEEADPNDPTLVRFPTDHKGIMEHLDRTRKSFEDATSFVEQSLTRSPGGSAIASASPSLPSLAEGNEFDELLEKVADSIPHVPIAKPSDITAALITPPLTPDLGIDKALDTEGSLVRDVQEKAEHLKEKAIETVQTATQQTNPGGRSTRDRAIWIASTSIVAASAAFALWYIRAKTEDIAI